MAPTYTFNFQLADQVRDSMASITKNMLATLTDLDLMARHSLQEWSGSAQQAYATHKQKWDAAAAQMPAALGRAESALAEISNGYLQVEHYAQSMWID